MATTPGLGTSLDEILPLWPAVAIKRWDELAPEIARALPYSYGAYTLDDLREEVDGEIAILWLVNDDPKQGIFITKLMGDLNPCLIIHMAAGADVSRWIGEASRIVEQTATRLGVKRIAFNARRGWEKMAREHGFQVSHIVGFKEI